MKLYNAIIIDDEEPARVTLNKLLEWIAPEINIIAQCASADEGIRAIEESHPDIVFLDIAMPVKNGFDLLQELQAVNFEVIFITAYDQFAVEAFKKHAIAYLLKPIDEQELLIAINRAKKQLADPMDESTLIQLFQSLQSKIPGFSKVAIPTIDGLELISIDQISHCSSNGNYTNIYMDDSTPLLVAKTLKQIEELLCSFPQIVRVHHSHIVNLFFVKKYHKGKGGSLVLEDGTVIPVSRSRKDSLLSHF